MAVRGRIDRLEITDFKSYRGRQIVGPFTDFTAIIGPNGSGKSNLMDAIAFVLGIASRHLRGTGKLESLVYNGSEMPSESGGSASAASGGSPAKGGGGGAKVTLVFVQGDEELHLTRSITKTGASKYRVGGKGVSKEKYEATLSGIGLVTRARNFLIAQGEVESLASKDPRGLCKLIETVSGSDAHAAEYEELRKAKDAAEQATKYSFQEKRRIGAEKKQMAEQLEEATRYENKKNEYEDLRVEYYLVQLKKVETTMTERKEAADVLKEEIEEGEAAEAAASERVTKEKRSKAGVNRKHLQGVKKFEKQRVEIGKLKPAVAKKKKEIAHAKKNAKAKEAAAVKIKRDIVKQEAQLEKVGESIEAVEEEQEEEEERARELATKGEGLDVSASQLAELETLKLKASTDALQLQSKADAAASAVGKAKEACAFAAEQDGDLMRRKNELVEQTAELESQEAKLGAAATASRTTLASLRRRETTMESESAGSTAKLANKSAELETVIAKLGSYKTQRRENKKRSELKEQVATLKRNFPGVHGRLIELAAPTQKRFNVAATRTLGKNIDAIVVDKQDDAFKCMQFLKESHTMRCSFIPLDSVRADATPARLRSLGDGYRLAIDCLKYDARFENAVQFACGDTVIADDLDAARSLCYSDDFERGGVKVRAITLKGDTIHRNGNMSGGSTDRVDTMDDDAFAEGEIEKLRSRRTELREEVGDLERKGGRSKVAGSKRKGRRGGGSVWEVQLESVRAEIGTTENRLQATESLHKQTLDKLKKKRKELSNVEKELRKLRPNLQRLQADVTTAEADFKKTTAAAEKVRSKCFSSWCRSVGVSSLAEFEEMRGKRATVDAKKRSALSAKKVKLEAQRDYCTRQLKDLRRPLKLAEQRVEKESKVAKAHEKDLAKLEASGEASSTKLDEIEASNEELEAKLVEAVAAVKEAAKQRDAVRKENKERQRQLLTLENSDHAERTKLNELLTKAKVEQVILPKVGDVDEIEEDTSSQSADSSGAAAGGRRRRRRSSAAAAEEDSSAAEGADRGRKRRRRDATGESGESSSAMETSGAEGSEGSAVSGMSRASSKNAKKNQKEMGDIDYSIIESRGFKSLSMKAYQEKIISLKAEIDAMQPNTHAEKHLKQVSERLTSTVDAFNAAKTKHHDCAEKFEVVREKRLSLFGECYKVVAAKINGIYKDLTKSALHPDGGTAHLTLQDDAEPFLGGITYTAMPPSKRFRDMDQLSGGEKTIAALALIFALHAYRPSPFYIMDEIDAALDKVNVAKVSNYIQAMSHSDFQCIVISLKDQFYSKADSLIGVHRDAGSKRSKTLTLRLTDFDDDESAATKEVESRGGSASASASASGRKKKSKKKAGRRKPISDATSGMTQDDEDDDEDL